VDSSLVDLYGLIQIDLLDECNEEIAELKEDVEEARGSRRAEVIKTLDESRTMVAVQVLWQGRETEPTLLKIDALWIGCFLIARVCSTRMVRATTTVPASSWKSGDCTEHIATGSR